MAKVIVNGKEVQPAKKVKLYEKITRTKVTKLLKQKREELKRESTST